MLMSLGLQLCGSERVSLAFCVPLLDLLPLVDEPDLHVVFSKLSKVATQSSC